MAIKNPENNEKNNISKILSELYEGNPDIYSKIANEFYYLKLQLKFKDQEIEKLKATQADNFYLDDKENWQNRYEEANLNKI